MVLPLTYKRSTDENLIDPDNLEVPRGLQSQLIFNKTVQTDTLASFLIRKAQDTFNAVTHKNENSPILSAQEANTKYGIKDRLDFKDNVSEAEAKAKYDRFNRAQEIERQLALADEQNTIGDKATNLMLGFAGNAPDIPLYALIPEAGVLRAAGVLKLARYSKTVTAAIRNPITRAMIAEGIESTAAQPIIADNYKYFGLNYGIEDGVADVVFGSLLGGAVGTGRAHIGGNMLLAKRKAREINLTNAKPLLGVLDNAMRGHGSGDTFDAIQSIVKLQNSIELRRIDGNSLYHSDFIYRNSFSDLPENLRQEVNLRAQSEPLIPQSSTQATDDLLRLAKNKPSNIIDPVQRKILKNVNADTKLIKFSDFINAISDLPRFKGISKTKIRKMMSEDFNINISSNRQGLQVDEALGVYDNLQRQAKRLETNELDPKKDMFSLLEGLKDKISKLENIYDLKPKQFRTEFKRAKKALDARPELKNVNIVDFQDLSDLDQKIILDYMRFFQEANLERSELDNLLKNNSDTFLEIQERAKFNKKYIDTVDSAKAYATARDTLARPDVPDIEAIKPSPLTKYVDSDFTIKQQVIDEEIETYRYKLTDEEFEGFQKEAKEETDKLIDDKAEALDVTTQCMLRGGL